jgi:hypothetical protein
MIIKCPICDKVFDKLFSSSSQLLYQKNECSNCIGISFWVDNKREVYCIYYNINNKRANFFCDRKDIKIYPHCEGIYVPWTKPMPTDQFEVWYDRMVKLKAFL